MINTTISYNNIKLVKSIPTSWSEVSFKTFLALTKANNQPHEMLSVLTGIEAEILKKAHISNLGQLLQILNFTTIPLDMRKVPDKLCGYDIPKTLDFETIGQYMDIKDIIDRNTDQVDMMESYPEMCAIYATKPYDYQKAKEKINEFLDSPCREVLAVGNFILLKLIALKNTTDQTYQKRLTLLTKLRLVLKSWLIRLAFSARYYIWKKKQGIKEVNF